MPSTHVYTISPLHPFVDALAAGLIERFGTNPLELSRVHVLLPTRRACRTLREAFLRLSKGAPLLLPRMTPIGDIDEDEFILTGRGVRETPCLSPSVSGLHRQMLLAHLLLSRGQGETAGQAAQLANDLGQLLDEMQTNGLALEALERVVPDRYAAHWQSTLRFLDVLTLVWPSLLSDQGLLDRAERRNALILAQAEIWMESPPLHPIIAAGSTGSVPATARLLEVVSQLPTGCVVLPGLDRTLDVEVDQSHPQFGMMDLVNRLGLLPTDVSEWNLQFTPPWRITPASRLDILQRALSPSSTVDRWQLLPPPPAKALAGVSYIECSTPQQEAGAIALLLREALEIPGRTAALVTPDRQLARRVTVELGRWNIDIDDSAGVPLSETSIGAFLRLTATMISEQLSPVPLLSALKHPLASGSLAPDRFRKVVRRFETRILRGPRPAPGWPGLQAAVDARAPADEDIAMLLRSLQSCGDAFYQAVHGSPVPLGNLLRLHILFAETLAATDDTNGADRLWSGDAGEAAAHFVSELAECADALQSVRGSDYPTLIEILMTGSVVRPTYGQHPRLAILGPLEARLQRPDLLILGSLNEGTWPRDVDPGPWLNRPMREQLGLPSPERRLGQAAHDFLMSFCAPNVVLTRATKVAGTPTTPSRWLQRLRTCMGEDMALPSRPDVLQWQAQLDAHNGPISPTPAPLPCPPLESRPRKLSVTQIERWMRDPYEIYASHILKLNPLEPLDANPAAADYGTVIHHALETFVSKNPGPLTTTALDALLATGREAFGDSLAQPGIWSFWWPRFERVAQWFINNETIRRQHIAESHVEVSGSMIIQGPAGPFELTCKADRLDVTTMRDLLITDYKTGTLPLWTDVQRGLSPQLPLEACIALAGGFPNILGRFDHVNEIAYWRLRGGAPAGEINVFKHSIEQLAADTLAGVQRLIEHFDTPGTCYPAQPDSKTAPRFSDYGHLARVKEWALADGG